MDSLPIDLSGYNFSTHFKWLLQLTTTWAFIKCRNNCLILSDRILFLLKILCPENPSVEHLKYYNSCYIYWKGHAQASLSLHRPLIRKSLSSFTWRLLVLGSFFVVGNFFYSLQSLQFLMVPTKYACVFVGCNFWWNCIAEFLYSINSGVWSLPVYGYIFISAISMCLLKIEINEGKTIEQLAHHLIRNVSSSEFSIQYTGENGLHFTSLSQIIPLILM